MISSPSILTEIGAAVQSAAPVATMRAVDHPPFKAMVLLAATSLGACAGASAGTIAGTVSFPSQVVPSMTVYASDLDTSRIHTVQLARGQVNFSVDVPPGRYLVFLAPNEPGAPDVYGAFTRYSQCAPHTAEDGACEDHALIAVAVTAKAPHAAVTIDDWYLTDDIADQLDRIRGAAGDRSPTPKEPLSAPKFSEYPSEPYEAGAPPKIDFGPSELSEEDRELAEAALAGGPNFAGHVTVTLTSCGAACGRVLLIDWGSGTVQELPPPGSHDESQGTLPCRIDEALQFRRDSRLLSLTRPEGSVVVTQYYVWTQNSAVPLRGGDYRRPSQAFCAVATG
jgi:hypothetical protein